MGAALVAHFRTLAADCDRHAFWSHSAGTALCARVLARAQGGSPENAYTAGLPHDIGRLILAARHPEAHQRVEAYRAAQDCYPLEAEREVLGFDHAQIGAALAARWRFPGEIAAAIAGHHAPADRFEAGLADLIHVADAMAHTLDFPGGDDDLVPALSPVAWQRLGLGWDQFERLLAEVDAQRGEAEQVLE